MIIDKYMLSATCGIYIYYGDNEVFWLLGIIFNTGLKALHSALYAQLFNELSWN